METRDVHVFVFDTLSDWEIGHVCAQLNSPIHPAAAGRYRVRTVAASRDTVRTAGGIAIVPDLVLSDVSPKRSAMWILPGGSSWDRGNHADAVQKAREFRAAGVPVAAICGATAGLARAGMLDGCDHTSNAKEYLQHQPGYGGLARYREARAIRDQGLITAGATAPLEFARAVFEALELFDPSVLEAWYGLFSTGDARYYRALMQATA